MRLILIFISRPVLEMDLLSRPSLLSRESMLMELVLLSNLVTTLKPKSLMLSSTTARMEPKSLLLPLRMLSLLLFLARSMMITELLLLLTAVEISLLHGSVVLEMTTASPLLLHPMNPSTLSGRMLIGPPPSTCLLMELISLEPMLVSRERSASKCQC